MKLRTKANKFFSGSIGSGIKGTAVLNPLGHSKEGVSGDSSIPITAAAKSVVSGCTAGSGPGGDSMSAWKSTGELDKLGREVRSDSGEYAHVLGVPGRSMEDVRGLIREHGKGTGPDMGETGFSRREAKEAEGMMGLGEWMGRGDE